MTKEKRVTIKSIGEDLGMSHMTVSRALSNNPNVSEKTRRAVQGRAAELGYVPNQSALAIRGDHSGVIGLLVPNIENEFYASFANHMSIYCEQENLQLMIGLTQDDPDVELATITRLRKHQVFAVVIVPTPTGLPQVATHLKEIQALQLIRSRDDIRAANMLGIEEAGCFSEAAQRLVDSGCKRIAFIGGNETLSTARVRYKAVERVLKREKLPVIEELFITGEPSHELGMTAMRQLMKIDARPDGVIAGGVEISNGALEACLADKIDIPGQVRFVGFGNPSWYRWAFGGITTIDLPIKQMAEASVDLLRNSQQDNPEIGLPAQLICRHSA